ncbi:MAG: hypothetical protein EOP88_10285 [Verrucomicrobiaceae bacterium]|nr:MAG: hypothetical protein EOP88_10285 [Verrucomicrobiaceae bacterium]
MTSFIRSFKFGWLIKMIAAVFLLQVAAHSQTEKEKPADPVVGKWLWIEKQIVECFPDGTFTAQPTNRKGKWKAVETKGEQMRYEFTWDDGLFTDSLLMSRDKKTLTGKNKDKKKITAEKVL